MGLPIRKIIFLSEGEKLENLLEYTYLYKYQSCDNIVKALTEAYGTLEHMNDVYGIKENKGKLIGVYSPINRCGKTALALSLANILGEETTSLFISLDTFSAFEKLFGVPAKDLSDLMYYYLQNPANLDIHLKTVVSRIYQIDYIHPVRYCKDLWDIPVSDWIRLIREICNTKRYENIVIDISNGFGQLYDVLHICDLIYVIKNQDFISGMKLQQFQESILHTDFIDILDKIKYVDAISPIEASTSLIYQEELFMGTFRKKTAYMLGDSQKEKQQNNLQIMDPGYG